VFFATEGTEISFGSSLNSVLSRRRPVVNDEAIEQRPFGAFLARRFSFGRVRAISTLFGDDPFFQTIIRLFPNPL